MKSLIIICIAATREEAELKVQTYLKDYEYGLPNWYEPHSTKSLSKKKLVTDLKNLGYYTWIKEIPSEVFSHFAPYGSVEYKGFSRNYCVYRYQPLLLNLETNDFSIPEGSIKGWFRMDFSYEEIKLTRH